MIFLQWAFVPNPNSASTSSVETTTVLFTPLATFKSHGTFAQPALCLTHYTDLADSHGLVLLRGEITTSDQGNAMVTSTDAQLLCWRLQQYFASDEGTQQQDLLKSFHGKGSTEFDLATLVESAWQV